MGYLPEAMRNFLAKLGWGHGDDELFSDEQAIAWFDLDDVTKAPARLDWDKLNHVNNHYLRRADDGRLTELVLHALKTRDVHLPADAQARLMAAIPLVKEGAKTTLELADLCLFALKTRPLHLDEKGRGQLNQETRERLGRLRGALAETPDWSPQALEAAIKAFAVAEEVGIGKFGQALRSVLSGGSPAPDLASALAILGREESLGRLEDALSQSQ
jgi:glutamyl-tRNA synthetase